MSPAVLRPYGRSTGTNSPDSSKSYSTNLPSLPVRVGISSYGYTRPRACERCTFCAYSSGGRSGSVGGSGPVGGPQWLGRGFRDVGGDTGTRCVREADRHSPWLSSRLVGDACQDGDFLQP